MEYSTIILQATEPATKQGFGKRASDLVLAGATDVIATFISVLAFIFIKLLVRFGPAEPDIQNIKNEKVKYSNTAMNNLPSQYRVKDIISVFVALYQRSLLHGWLHRNGYGCRFIPSCTEYAIRAVNKYGFWYGILLTGGRFRRCVPFYQGDYVDFP